MHELGLIRNVLQRASEIAEAHGGLPIASIHLRVGVYQQIVPELFRFAFQAAKAGTLAEHGTLTWETVALKVACADCSKQYFPESLLWSCPSCRSNKATLLEGNELILDHVTLMESDEPHAVSVQGEESWKSL